MIRLTLPYPPSVNRMYRAFRGRQILSREGRAFKERTASLAIGAKPLSGEVRVTLGVYRPAKRGDLDNTMKATLDALRGVAYHDDKQVVAIDAERFDDKHEPRVEVLVQLAHEPPPDAGQGSGAHREDVGRAVDGVDHVVGRDPLPGRRRQVRRGRAGDDKHEVVGVVDDRDGGPEFGEQGRAADANG